ncbi:inositol monophosphatase family protein, partial [Corynebacterium striatum]
MIDAITKTFLVAHVDDTDAHLAQALVYNAGRLAWRMREQGVDINQKTSVSDVVTDADRAAERFVAGVLEVVRPEDGILGEEGATRPSTSGRTWVIDP